MDIRKRNNVKVSGRGSQPIVFVHGFGCDQAMWRYVTPAFEDDYKVVVLDLVGAGNSDASSWTAARYATLEGHAKDLLEVCQVLDLRDVILVGHSVSAMIGILAANAEPSRFSRLVLIGPSPRYVNDVGYVGGFERSDIEGLLQSLESNFLGWSSTMAPVIMGNPERPELGAELTNSFCRTNPEIAAHFAKVTFLSDNRNDLPKVTTKSLVVQCSDDVIAPLEVGQYVHRHLPGSEMVVLKARGHCPNLSAPEETIGAIRSFL